MNNNEKILLLELLLRDIRGNWGWHHKSRTDLARTLATELGFEKHAKKIEAYEAMIEIDGRFFRTSFTNGGYEGMGTLHNLNSTYKDKSDEFKKLVDDYLTYPEYLFEDVSG